MIIATAACLFGLAVGGWAGWSGRGRKAHAQPEKASQAAEEKVAETGGRPAVDVSCLWDPHGCLNALNRCIISGPVPPADDNPLYVVSDHLRLLAQLSQSGGWVSPARLQEWLETLLALQPDASVEKACRISLPQNTLQQLQIVPLGIALQPLLRQARPVAGVSIEAGEVSFPNGAGQNASIVLRLQVSEGRKADAPATHEAARGLRNWDVQVVCECTVVH